MVSWSFGQACEIYFATRGQLRHLDRSLAVVFDRCLTTTNHQGVIRKECPFVSFDDTDL